MWSYSYSGSRLHPSLRDETNRRPTAASPQEPATPPRTRWRVSRSRNRDNGHVGANRES